MLRVFVEVVVKAQCLDDAEAPGRQFVDGRFRSPRLCESRKPADTGRRFQNVILRVDVRRPCRKVRYAWRSGELLEVELFLCSDILRGKIGKETLGKFYAALRDLNVCGVVPAHFLRDELVYSQLHRVVCVFAVVCAFTLRTAERLVTDLIQGSACQSFVLPQIVHQDAVCGFLGRSTVLPLQSVEPGLRFPLGLCWFRLLLYGFRFRLRHRLRLCCRFCSRFSRNAVQDFARKALQLRRKNLLDVF